VRCVEARGAHEVLAKKLSPHIFASAKITKICNPPLPRALARFQAEQGPHLAEHQNLACEGLRTAYMGLAGHYTIVRIFNFLPVIKLRCLNSRDDTAKAATNP
jgi:hypothetical protein